MTATARARLAINVATRRPRAKIQDVGWAALRLENSNVQTEPTRLVVNAWEDRDVFSLRRAMRSIVEQWQDLHPESDICPVSFNEQELALSMSRLY